MAINRQPVLKRCKTLGINPATMGIDKSSNRNPKQGRKKQSEYCLQLNEKQKVKFIYGVLEAIQKVLCNGYKETGHHR